MVAWPGHCPDVAIGVQLLPFTKVRDRVEKSTRAHGVLSGSLAQLVEQRTLNPLVVGSNPTRPTNTSKGQPHGWPFVFLDRDHTIASRSVL